MRANIKLPKSIGHFGFIAIIALMSGCASQLTAEPSVSIDKRGYARNRDAEMVLPMFVGRYQVTDSRMNQQRITEVHLSILDGIPTLALFSEGGQLIRSIAANECSGDVINKYSQNSYLVCFASQRYSTLKAFFSISKVPVDYVHKSGALIPAYSPMPVTEGYFIQFEPGQRAILYPLAAKRVER